MAKELIPSLTLLRRDFLARIADVSPNTILDLFKDALTPFKAMGECTVELFDIEYPCTQFISFGMLDSDEWLGVEFSEERQALQKALKDWGVKRSLLDDWVSEHAIQALRCFEWDTLDTEAALQAWRRACLRLDEQAKKESVSPEAVMIWRDGVFGASRELVERSGQEVRAGFRRQLHSGVVKLADAPVLFRRHRRSPFGSIHETTRLRPSSNRA
jgi:hypothetical protein